MAKVSGLGERKCPACKEVIKVDATVCKHCSTSFSAQEVAAAVIENRKANKFATIGCLATVLVIGSCVALMPSGSEPAKSVKASSAEVAQVDAYPDTGHSNVKVDLAQSWSASDLPVQAAMAVQSAGKAIKAGASDIPPEIKTVRFWFTGPLVDQYGQESRSKVLQFTMKADDLRKVENKNIAPQDLLEFAYDVSFGGRAGRLAAEEYCRDKALVNPRFCSEVAS